MSDRWRNLWKELGGYLIMCAILVDSWDIKNRYNVTWNLFFCGSFFDLLSNLKNLILVYRYQVIMIH